MLSRNSSQNSLTHSNSSASLSSSLLLNSANLSWSQPSSGILVSPQPPIDTPVIAKLLDDVTPHASHTNLDNFQTISLDAADKSQNDSQIHEQLLHLQHLSLKSKSEPSIPSIGDTNTTANITNISASSQLPNISFSDRSHSLTPTLSSNLYQQTHYSSPNFSDTSVPPPPIFSSNFQASDLLQPQTAPPALPLPPKGTVTRDYKRHGPLRLYDPSHGLHTNSPQNNYTNASQQLNATITPTVTQNIISPTSATTAATISCDYVEPVPQIEQTLYNPLAATIPPTDNTSQYLANDSYDSYNSDQQLQQQYNYSAHDNNQTTHYPYVNNAANADYISNSDYSNSAQYLQGSSPQQANNNNMQYLFNSVYPQQQYTNAYTPVVPHWFYQKVVENREVWLPFTLLDSYQLENAFLNNPNNDIIISTDGGRFDVNVYERIRAPVYWSESNTIVRRCSWFYKKEGHNRFAPYPEDFAAKLEDAYRECLVNNRWNQRIDFPGQEYVVMHTGVSIYHYQSDLSAPDGWGSMVENPVRPRIVHRGAFPIFNDVIEEGEPTRIDHLVFLIHGIGEICDFRFRSIVEVVDDFRAISLSLTRTHYKPWIDSGSVGRIEILPISWHASLHGEETGIDETLKLITLNSIPKLRHFSNDTILDALFYTSPLYCQTIVDNVGSELNRLFAMFKQRNPHFCGTVALGGHSLGSLIIFDILAHQQSNSVIQDNNDSNQTELLETNNNINLTNINDINTFLERINLMDLLDTFNSAKIDFETLLLMSDSDFETLNIPLGYRIKLIKYLNEYRKQRNSSNNFLSPTSAIESEHRKRSITCNYNFESMGIGYPSIVYPRLDFNPSCFFAMGSPIAMFLTVRGIKSINPEFRLPTCPAVYNIFHPFDPIAYRIEPLIDHSFINTKPVLIPHHKGRKRMHLELKDSISRMGTDLKQKIYDSLKYTWNSINEFARAHKTSAQSAQSQQSLDNDISQLNEEIDNSFSDSTTFGFDAQSFSTKVGLLNYGRRIDYVLQEKPIEIFNEYLFAMASHACYWESEDTALLILRELYGQMGVFGVTPQPLPQQQQSQHYAYSNSNNYLNETPVISDENNSAHQSSNVHIVL